MANQAPAQAAGQSVRRTLVPTTQCFVDAGFRSRSAGYEAIAAGLLPQPVHVGRASVMPSDEVAQVIDARVAGRSNDEIRLLVQQLHQARREVSK